MTDAEKKYTEQYNKAILQIETLHLAIENHERQAVTVGTNWTHVGDLQHFNNELESLIKFMQQ
jgi:hypothetical protein